MTDYTDQINWIIPKGITDRTYERKFRRKLRRKGLSLMECDVAVLKYIYEYTLEEITEALQLASLTVSHNLLESGLKKFKEKSK